MTQQKESPGSPFSKRFPELLEKHYQQLQDSGIIDEVIRERGYKSVLGSIELKELGFSNNQRRTRTLLIPVWTADGSNAFHIHRPDSPRENKKGKAIKYENPSGNGLRIDVPPRCREKLKDPCVRLWVVEGIKKGDSLASQGECAIALLGVYGFKHKNELGATTISADLDYIAWEGREVYICFDNDVMTKPEVKRALELFKEHLKRKGAIVYHVYLPLGNGKKMGVDDFLVDHTIDDLLTYAVKQDESSRVQEEREIRYSFDDTGYLGRSKFINDSLIHIRLCNFDARIAEELIKDNGLETSNSYKIEAKTKDRYLGFVEVPAANFSGMSWVHKLGYDAIIEPGANVKDFVRHYIQTRSSPKEIRVYAHTGWRIINNEWVYLFSGGAIGKEGLNISLSSELQRYSLPLSTPNEGEAIKASLGLLEIGNRKTTLPLFSYLYLSPLTTLLSPLPNFSLYLFGETGVFKTTLAILMLSHFGDFQNVENLNNFEDTGNAIGKRAFTLKDTLMVVDDYHPSSQRFIAQQKEALAQRLIREFANRTERGRLNADTTEKLRYAPRGMLVITGEELLSLQSTLARVLVVEVGKRDIDKDQLSALQAKALLLPEAMSSYLQWLIRKGIEHIQSRFKEKFPALRAKVVKNSIHPKLAEQVAFLQFSLSNTLDWLLDKEAITEEKAKELIKEGWGIFNELVDENQQRIQNEDPVNKFIDILNSLLVQKKVRIEHRVTQGYYLGDDFQNTQQLNSDFIGYYDDNFLYLLPIPLWKVLQHHCSTANELFPVSRNTLYRMLEKRELIETRDGKHTIPFKHKGHVLKVLKIAREGIFEKEVTKVTNAENHV